MKIPRQLQNPEFRFYLVGKGSKLPMQEKWNTEVNYEFFDPVLINHLNSWGNYGIVTGFGNLIVVDFDAKQVQDKYEEMLPNTFTVRTAGKGLHHLYFYLKGDMIETKGQDMYYNHLNKRYYTINPLRKFEGLKKKRVYDVQAKGSGIVAPGSEANRRFYEVVNDVDIAEIDLESLKAVFKLSEFRLPTEKKTFKFDASMEYSFDTHRILNNLNIERGSKTHYKCPFHATSGKGNLMVYPNSSVHCFHCKKTYRNLRYFVRDVLLHRKQDATKQIIDGVINDCKN